MTESRDVFFCHASEDKAAVVHPLAKALKAAGLTYWLDEDEIQWGDIVTATIDHGLSISKFVVVVISSNSLGKPWPTWELNAMLSRDISSGKIRVLPLLVGDVEDRRKFREQLPLLADKRYLVWKGDPEPIVKALRARIEPSDLSGIVDCERVRASRTKLPGEVFVIELLNQPIDLERDGAGVTITVDRRDITQCVINNAGKSKLIDNLITPFADVISTLDSEDLRIQRFLTEKTVAKTTISPRELKVPLRWASGGVLSLVSFKQKEWVPLFFRDIPPYGWNISLGSSERRFDRHGQAQSDDEAEHRYPWDFISREFLEESIVINRRPDSEDPLNPTAFRAFTAAFPLPGFTAERWRKYADFRRRCDNLASHFDGSPIRLNVVPLEPQMTLKILSRPLGGEPSDLDWSKESNVLVCFSLRDLGIEVVRVFRYELQDNDYLLDGEIDHEGCLVRMPMVLFSHDYLAETFTHDENWNHYVAPFGEPPSIQVRRAPTVSEVVPFLWDVEQRVKIMNGKIEGTEHERTRFRRWYNMFHPDFLDDEDRPSLANPSCLFVPGTAKILSLYFSSLSK
ncbi:MAG: TIR domain-containing protein [Thermoanaerobaculia bacterium]